ncbi:MAG: cytochrome c oxidase subunit 3 [Actinomycetota bacterium]
MSATTDRQLPAGAPPAARNTILVGVGAVAVAGTMLMYGMLAIWFKFRDAAPLRTAKNGKLIRDWLPADIAIPEVVTNTLMITMVVICVMAQWAVYSAKRNDSSHAGLALVVTSMLGVAAINGQVAVYVQMGIGIMDGPYQTMFYAVTGTMLFLLVTGLAFSVATMFRVYAGRVRDYQVVSAHALYWYFLATAFLAMWFVVYVQK